MVQPADVLHNCSPETDSRRFGRVNPGGYAMVLKEATINLKKSLWEKGDFTEIAAFMRQSGEVVVESLEIKPSLRVLDLGCGDGTTAVPLARLGADVVGIDIARNLVEAGNRRAAEAGLSRL